jgi:hypothetical protein
VAALAAGLSAPLCGLASAAFTALAWPAPRDALVDYGLAPALSWGLVAAVIVLAGGIRERAPAGVRPRLLLLALAATAAWALSLIALEWVRTYARAPDLLPWAAWPDVVRELGFRLARVRGDPVELWGAPTTVLATVGLGLFTRLGWWRVPLTALAGCLVGLACLALHPPTMNLDLIPLTALPALASASALLVEGPCPPLGLEPLQHVARRAPQGHVVDA